MRVDFGAYIILSEILWFWDLRVIAPIEYHPCHFGVNTWLSLNRRAKVRSEAVFAKLGVTLSGIRGGFSCLWGTVGKFSCEGVSVEVDDERPHFWHVTSRGLIARFAISKWEKLHAMTLSDLSPDLKTPSTYVSRRYLKWGLTKWFWPIKERCVLSFTLISNKISGRADEDLDVLQK